MVKNVVVLFSDTLKCFVHQSKYIIQTGDRFFHGLNGPQRPAAENLSEIQRCAVVGDQTLESVKSPQSA